ncbi:MAG: hypothetical protein WA418_35140 [Bradyrhizobium sp.]
MKRAGRLLLVVAIVAGSFHQALAQSPAKSDSPRTADAKAPAKILVSSHRGDATILTLSDVDSDTAAVTFRIELDDAIESCLREPPPDDIKPADVARCAKQVMDLDAGKQTKRRAMCSMCSKNTVYTEFGNFSLVGTGEPESSEGKKMIRTGWKDHRNDQIVGNSTASRTDAMLSTFRILCPSVYKAKFDGCYAY